MIQTSRYFGGFHKKEDDIPVDFFLTAGSIWVDSHHPVSDVYVRVHLVPPRSILCKGVRHHAVIKHHCWAGCFSVSVSGL